MSVLDNTAPLREILALTKALIGSSESGGEPGGDDSGGTESGGSGSGGYGGTGSNTLSISAQVSSSSECYAEPCYGHFYSLAVRINAGTTMYFSAEPYCEYVVGEEAGVVRHADHVVNLDNLSYEDVVVVITDDYSPGLSYDAEGCAVEVVNDDTTYTITITNIEEHASLKLVYYSI